MIFIYILSESDVIMMAPVSLPGSFDCGGQERRTESALLPVLVRGTSIHAFSAFSLTFPKVVANAFGIGDGVCSSSFKMHNKVLLGNSQVC